MKQDCEAGGREVESQRAKEKAEGSVDKMLALRVRWSE